MKKNLVSIENLGSKEILNMFQLAESLKKRLRRGERTVPFLAGKSLAMIFEKPSMRTRVSFEIGMRQLGGYALYLSPSDVRMGKRETVEDVAGVLSRYVDGIMVRVFAHETVLRMDETATVPVINGLSDLLHPCQVLSDMFTLWEKEKELSRMKVAFIGDGNNVCHSWILGAAKMGIELRVATPRGYEPREEIIEKAKGISKRMKLKIFHDPGEAVKGAEVIYTDVWASMGQEEEREERERVFRPFQVNRELVSRAQDGVLVMHCLPAHRGEEITEEVLEGTHSIVLDQAENRLHFQKAILVKLLGENK